MKRKRPKITKGITVKGKTGCGMQYITINKDDSGPCEVFIILGKCGGCVGTLNAVIGRLISMALRSGIGLDEILTDLEEMNCPQSVEGSISCPQGIANAIKKYMEEDETRP